MSAGGGIPPAVVLGLSPTGLYAVRELGEAGIDVLGVSREYECGNASRYLTGSFVEPNPLSILRRLEERFGLGGAKPILIPTSDQDIDLVLKNKERLAERFSFQPSYDDGAALTLMSKPQLYALCDERGVDVPHWVEVSSAALGDIQRDVRFPCVVKPARVHEIKHRLSGKKGWVVRNASELRALHKRIPAGRYDVVVQEIIPGPEHLIELACAYFDREGEPRQAFTCRKLRQFPPGFGSASLVQSEVLPEVQERSVALLRSIKYRGIVATEFKRDPRDGRLKIIEINPRPSLWFSLSTAAGKRVMLAAYHDLAQTGQMVGEVAQRTDVAWRYGLKDAYSSLFYKFRPGFTLPPPDVRPASAVAVIVDAVHNAGDPAPARADAGRIARKLKDRVLGLFGKDQQ